MFCIYLVPSDLTPTKCQLFHTSCQILSGVRPLCVVHDRSIGNGEGILGGVTRNSIVLTEHTLLGWRWCVRCYHCSPDHQTLAIRGAIRFDGYMGEKCSQAIGVSFFFALFYCLVPSKGLPVAQRNVFIRGCAARSDQQVVAPRAPSYGYLGSIGMYYDLSVGSYLDFVY